ncbi:MAG: ATP-binding protein [Sulfurovum sp.]|nr:ATP-binding protein [Sulfurovum sp.]
MTVEIPTHKHIDETQSIDFSSSNICTFIGKNGSGKSTLLESIFENNRDKNIISFSSGQNELFTTIYEDIKNSTFKQLKKIGADFQNIKKYHFDSNWVRTLIFFATSMKNGLVRTYLKENSYIEINSLNDLTSKLKLEFEIPQYYIDVYQNAIEKESLEPDFMSVRRTYIQQYIEKIIENKIDNTYGFEEKIAKQTIEIKAEDVLLLFDNDSFKVFTFISLANKAAKPIFSYKSATLHFRDNLEFAQLSDGEYQLLAIYALIDLFDNENTIFLFDEIDSHLHYSNINKLWSKLKIINGKIITTTHSSESILQNDFDNLAYIENGKIKKELTPKKSLQKISAVVNKEKFIYQASSRLNNLVLIDDESDWEIFKRLAIKKIGVEAEEILNKIVAIKETSSYNSEYQLFGDKKIEFVQNIKNFSEENSITIKNIFMICDKDEYNSTSVNDDLSCKPTEKLYPLLREINSFNHDETKSYLLCWGRREILHYMISYTMIEAYEKLDNLTNIAQYVNESYRDNNFDTDNNIKMTSKENVKFIKVLMTKDDGNIEDDNWTDYNKLRDIIDKIPPEEISEDIVKMYNFIKSKVEG